MSLINLAKVKSVATIVVVVLVAYNLLNYKYKYNSTLSELNSTKIAKKEMEILYESCKESTRISDDIQKALFESYKDNVINSHNFIFGSLHRDKSTELPAKAAKNTSSKTRELNSDYRQDFFKLRVKYNEQREQLESLIDFIENSYEKM